MHPILPIRRRLFDSSDAFAALAVMAALLLGLSGCAVVSVAGAVVGGVITVGSAVVGTTVKVAGKVVEKSIDAVTPASPPPTAPEPK